MRCTKAMEIGFFEEESSVYDRIFQMFINEFEIVCWKKQNIIISYPSNFGLFE